jgi:hypothetical protein
MPGAFAFIVAASLLLPGCGRKEVSPPASPPPIPTPPPSKFQLVCTSLQAEFNDLRKVTFEPDPAKRPLFLSERAPNLRDWALRALERGYALGGGTNNRWDSQMHAAFEAYVDYSRAGATDRHYAALTNAVLAAIAAGSHDPMLRYMQVRYGIGTTNRWEQHALDQLHAFLAVFGSQHHPVFKYTAGYRAVMAARETDGMCDLSGAMGLVTTALEDLARDTNAPIEEVLEPASWLLVEFNPIKGWPICLLTNVQPILERNWGARDAYCRWRGLAEIACAWDDRGGGYAQTVGEAAWEGSRQHLEHAQTALETAWQMNPSNAYTAYLMMRVELGQGRGRDRMEQWFRRAMTLATNYHDAVNLMAQYLEPRWYGSEKEALEFGRACVASTNWGGEVPLVLPNLHRSLAWEQQHGESPEYWRRPEVWEDVRSAYAKFFALNPEASYYHHHYARDAFSCGHYDVFLAQCKLLPRTNFYFFGGEAKFRGMLELAAYHQASGARKQAQALLRHGAAHQVAHWLRIDDDGFNRPRGALDKQIRQQFHVSPRGIPAEVVHPGGSEHVFVDEEIARALPARFRENGIGCIRHDLGLA